MPRGPRLDAPGALHHVIARGIERGGIFTDDADRSEFLQRLATVLTTTGSACYAWCLMPNHFHLLWRSAHMFLGHCLRRILGGYASAFNRRHQRSGHLFQNRFKSTIVQDDLYLLELVRYIHLNPLRAHLVADLAALDTYAWTGHAALLGHSVRPWQDTGTVLEHFGARLGAARAAYRTFVEAACNAPSVDLAGGGLCRSHSGSPTRPRLPRGRERWTFDERILGSPAFVAAIVAESPPAAPPALSRVEAAVLLPALTTRVAHHLGLSVAEVTARSRRSAVVRARDIVSYLAVCCAGLLVRQVSPWVGLSPRAVLDAVIRGRADVLAHCIARDEWPALDAPGPPSAGG